MSANVKAEFALSDLTVKFHPQIRAVKIDISLSIIQIKIAAAMIAGVDA